MHISVSGAHGLGEIIAKHALNIYVHSESRARICKRKGVQESIPPVYLAWRAGTTNRVIVLAPKLHRLAESISWNRFLCSFTFTNSAQILRGTPLCHAPKTPVFKPVYRSLCRDYSKLKPLQIGDHFFLNLNSVVGTVDPVLIMFRILDNSFLFFP
jgi:hypothetical protein